jgi:replicative DNA helicase
MTGTTATNATTPLTRRDQARPTALREIPTSHSAEAAVLGSMIVDPRCIPDVMQALEASDFWFPENAAIYNVIRILYEQNEGRGVDGLLVRQSLSDKGLLAEIGGGNEAEGTGYLQQVVETVPSSASVEFYLDIVKDKSRRRFLITTGGRIVESAYDEAQPVEEVLNSAESQLFAITQKDRRSGLASEMGDLAVAVLEDISGRKKGMLRGLSSGFYAVDDVTCGFRKGDMILVAGRPSMGKTALAMDVAMHAAVTQGKGVAVFSLEMSASQLAERSLCSWAEVDSQKAAHNTLTLPECEALFQAAHQFKEAKLYIDDASGLTPFQLRSKARQLKLKYGIDLVVIDYIQLMDAGARCDSRQQEITYISRQIKAVARELDVPLIALSQLNRGPEGREDHRPRLSDLRESGALEQDADLVVLLHREDYYHRGQANYEPTHAAEAIIAKQRKGPVGIVTLTFRDVYSKFVNHIDIPVPQLPPPSAAPDRGEEPW